MYLLILPVNIYNPVYNNLNRCPLISPILALYSLANYKYSKANSSKSFISPENNAGFSNNASDDITASTFVS